MLSFSTNNGKYRVGIVQTLANLNVFVINNTKQQHKYTSALYS